MSYISMSSEDHEEIPPKLYQKDSLYPMGRRNSRNEITREKSKYNHISLPPDIHITDVLKT